MGSFIPNIDLTVLKKFFGGVEGRGSFIVSDTVSPILEIQDIALFQRRETLLTFDGRSLVGQTTDFTVDPGEFWLIHYLAATTETLDADQAVTLQLEVSPVGIGRLFRILVPVTIGNSEQGGIGAAFGRPLILQSAVQFGVAINAITVGAAGSLRVDLAANISRVNT